MLHRDQQKKHHKKHKDNHETAGKQDKKMIASESEVKPYILTQSDVDHLVDYSNKQLQFQPTSCNADSPPSDSLELIAFRKACHRLNGLFVSYECCTVEYELKQSRCKAILEQVMSLANDPALIKNDLSDLIDCIIYVALKTGVITTEEEYDNDDLDIDAILIQMQDKYTQLSDLIQEKNNKAINSNATCAADGDDNSAIVLIQDPFFMIEIKLETIFNSIKNALEIDALFNTPTDYSDQDYTQLCLFKPKSTTDEIKKAIEFLDKNIVFFASLFEGDIKKTSAWALKNELLSNVWTARNEQLLRNNGVLSEDEKLSGELLRSLHDTVFVIPWLRAQFRNALIGNLDNTRPCLRTGDIKQMKTLLLENPSLLKLLNENVDNPIIDKWYREHQHLVGRDIRY